MLSPGDRAGVFNTATCLTANRCPAAQHDRCHRTVAHRPAVTQEDIGRHPARIERPSLPYTLHPGTRTVVLGQALPPRDRHNLAHVPAITLRSPENPAERY
ncbi:hypothetical protein ACFV42_48210 [Streptomyces solisilvae]|uniref:hypothetical protein n=1 Tax=Streptomyces malaysiensis TaxID=92644 RepID=UPI0036CE068F